MDSAPGTTRLFLALWPEAPVRAALHAWRDSWTWPKGAAPVQPANLHMTLHFLGSTPIDRVPELAQGLALPFSPFALAFGQSKLWPHGIAVLEPESIPAPLLDLHGGLGEALQRLGLPVEARQFKPHVTMARRAAKALEPPAGPPLTWSVEGYALMESRGGEYGIVRRFR